MRGVFVPFLSVTLLLAFSTESTSLASSPPPSSSSSSSSEPFITLSSPYHECCQYLQNQQQEYQLINCINTTITTYDIPTIPTIIPYYQQRLGPKLFITLMTRITPEIYNYAAYSYFLQAIYANINGYLLLPLYDDSNMEDYSLYRKLAPIQEALLGISADCDYIVWMDADLVILDLGMRIEKIAAENPKGHIIVSADVSAIMNSGFIIFKNTPWTMKFIKQWWDARSLSQNSVTDQMGFEYVYDRLSPEEKSRIVILAPDALNSDAPPMTRQLPHNQVLHLAAESSTLRRNIFHHGMKEVCDSYQQQRQPASQISLHRELIRNMTEMSYGIQAQHLLSKYRNWNYQRDIVKDRETLLNDMTTLRYDTSKHVYAMNARNRELESLESLKMRKDTSQTIENITAEILSSILRLEYSKQPTISGKEYSRMMHHQDIGLLLNLLKISSESSYEYLQALQSGIFSEDSPLFPEWKLVANQLQYNLHLLSNLVGKQQQHLILDMQGSLLGNLGELFILATDCSPSLGDLYLNIDRGEESIKLFRESLSIYKRMKTLKDEAGLGGGGGDKRALLGIQSSLARALCSGSNTDEAMELFRATISEESHHVGAYHHNLLTKYFNAGICAASKGLIVEALEYMNNCLKTCESNPHIPNDNTCRNAQRTIEELHRRRRFAPSDL